MKIGILAAAGIGGLSIGGSAAVLTGLLGVAVAAFVNTSVIDRATTPTPRVTPTPTVTPTPPPAPTPQQRVEQQAAAGATTEAPWPPARPGFRNFQVEAWNGDPGHNSMTVTAEVYDHANPNNRRTQRTRLTNVPVQWAQRGFRISHIAGRETAELLPLHADAAHPRRDPQIEDPAWGRELAVTFGEAWSRGGMTLHDAPPAPAPVAPTPPPAPRNLVDLTGNDVDFEIKDIQFRRHLENPNNRQGVLMVTAEVFDSTMPGNRRTITMDIHCQTTSDGRIGDANTVFLPSRSGSSIPVSGMFGYSELWPDTLTINQNRPVITDDNRMQWHDRLKDGLRYAWQQQRQNIRLTSNTPSQEPSFTPGDVVVQAGLPRLPGVPLFQG